MQIKTEYIEDVVSSAFLHLESFTICAHWRSLALAGLHTEMRYLKVVVSSAFLDVTFVYTKCALEGWDSVPSKSGPALTPVLHSIKQSWFFRFLGGSGKSRRCLGRLGGGLCGNL